MALAVFGERDDFEPSAGTGVDHQGAVKVDSCEFVCGIRITQALRYLGGSGVSACANVAITAVYSITNQMPLMFFDNRPSENAPRRSWSTPST